MTDLKLLDPTRAGDPAFDPDSPQAQRVREAARRAPAPAPPRGRRRFALGLAAAAVTAAAAVVATGTTAPTDARAALLQAARQTAAVDSGRVVWTLQATMPNGYRADVRNEIRFSGDDFELVARGDETLPDGTPMSHRSTFRIVDGVGYERDEGDAGFTRLGPVEGGFSERLTREVSDGALLKLVRAADDVTVEGNTYRATVTAGEVEDAIPSAPGRSTGPAWDRPVKLEVTVEDDLLRRFVMRDGSSTRTTEYLDLGSPQVIARP